MKVNLVLTSTPREFVVVVSSPPCMADDVQSSCLNTSTRI